MHLLPTRRGAALPQRDPNAAIPLLVVDDDVELCALLEEFLVPEGFAVKAVHDAAAGVEEATAREYALIILDVMLPGFGGLEALRRIRARRAVPVIMLTARGDPVDRVVGLEMGADDYVPKPCDPRELLARVRAVLRRAAPETVGETPAGALRVGDVELELSTRVARRGGEPVELTGLEFDLLAHLMEQAGEVVARDELAVKVLRRPFDPLDRSIDVHVSNLRRKLQDGEHGERRIRTVRGRGYLFAKPIETAGRPA